LGVLKVQTNRTHNDFIGWERWSVVCVSCMGSVAAGDPMSINEDVSGHRLRAAVRIEQVSVKCQQHEDVQTSSSMPHAIESAISAEFHEAH
jgi:hypothetical protein